MRRPAWLTFIVAAAVGIVVALVAVISRAPMPERQGTAPSVITDRTGAEAQPLGPPGTNREPREVDTSSNSGRAARGSGVEGVTSGNTTIDAPSGR